MTKPDPQLVDDLRRKISAHLPGWTLQSIFMRHGRWMAYAAQDAEYDIGNALENVHQVQPMLRQRDEAVAWKKNLTAETATEIAAMCRRLIAGNPNNRFVREQYPHLYAEITAEQQTATTHQGKEHATQKNA